MSKCKNEIYLDNSSEWRWRRIASNGKIVGASSQGYVNKIDCIANLEREKSLDRWEFYKDANEKWRWRCIASNGRIVGASSQGYVNKIDCIANAKTEGYK